MFTQNGALVAELRFCSVRRSTIQCFFCQSPVNFPADVRNFLCSACGCWNRYDAQGQIISDTPAMHYEHLNSKSFSKRAAPSKDRLPTMYGPGPFCHSCQTNQMLIINLLANYLPDPESPEYESRLEMQKSYEESLHARYPPVCESCLPQVEEEIRRKEQMARSKALGGWLSKGMERKRRVSGPRLERETKVSEVIFWWRVRGCLWALTLCISLMCTLSAIFEYYPLRWLLLLRPILPFIVGISVLWTAWDPTYASFRKSQTQGRDVRIHGKQTYNILQILAWSIRMCTSILLSIPWYKPHLAISQPSESVTHIYLTTAFVIELSTVVISYFVLRIQQPPSIRLVDTHAHTFDKSRSGTPVPDSRGTTPTLSKFPSSMEHDTLHALSLSSKPVITNPKHVFGLPSLQGSSTQPQPQTPAVRVKANDDEMDWTPTHPEAVSDFGKQPAPSDGDNSWLRPQRFFAPEKPTGLEGLFESARIRDEPMPFAGPDTTQSYRSLDHLRKWRWIYTLCVGVSVVCMLYTLKWLGLMRSAV